MRRGFGAGPCLLPCSFDCECVAATTNILQLELRSKTVQNTQADRPTLATSPLHTRGHIGDQLQLHCWGGWQHYCSFLRAPRVYAMQHTLPFVSQSGRPAVISLSRTPHTEADRRRYACHCAAPTPALGLWQAAGPYYVHKQAHQQDHRCSPVREAYGTTNRTAYLQQQPLHTVKEQTCKQTHWKMALLAKRFRLKQSPAPHHASQRWAQHGQGRPCDCRCLTHLCPCSGGGVPPTQRNNRCTGGGCMPLSRGDLGSCAQRVPTHTSCMHAQGQQHAAC